PVTGSHLELAHGHARAGSEVHLDSVLDDPACRFQSDVDLLAGDLFGCRAHAGPGSGGSIVALGATARYWYRAPAHVRLDRGAACACLASLEIRSPNGSTVGGCDITGQGGQRFSEWHRQVKEGGKVLL